MLRNDLIKALVFHNVTTTLKLKLNSLWLLPRAIKKGESQYVCYTLSIINALLM